MSGNEGAALVHQSVATQADSAIILDLMSGPAVTGNAVTATLFVSPNGDGSDGSTWAKAYQTIQAALDAASTDTSDCTLILIAPKATAYNIDTTGDPTWAGNYILSATERSWVSVNNTHAAATSIMKFTGKVSLRRLAFSLTAARNGVILTGKGPHIYDCGFNGTNSTGASTALWLDGATTIRGAYIEHIDIFGHNTYTTGLLVDNCADSEFVNTSIHDCLVGLQQVGADSDGNNYDNLDIGDCNATVAVEGADGIAIDIQAGNEPHFHTVTLHHNTINVADAVGDAVWNNINGEFPVTIEPTDLTGVSVASGNGAWGGDIEVRAAVAATKPFKVLSYKLDPSTVATTQIRFSADSGTTHFAQLVFSSAKNQASGGGPTVDFIFNVGTRISASGWSGGAGRTINVWLEILEI